MSNKTIYYGFTLGEKQNANYQVNAFRQHGASDQDIVIDDVSNKQHEKPGYNALKHEILGLKNGDNLIVYDIRNLSRTKKGVKCELEYWRDRGVYVKFITIPSSLKKVSEQKEDVQKLIADILIESFDYLAKHEEKLMKRKQREGIDAMPVIDGKRYSKKTGRATGRPKTNFPVKWEKYYGDWKAKKITAIECMSLLNLKKNTFYSLVKRYENELPE